MKKITVFVFVLLAGVGISFSQSKYFTKNATVSFLNKTAVENMEATNKAGTVVIDGGKGTVAFSLLIKSFTFSKSLMQAHFNENYMESDKFPKSEFKGTITNNQDIKYTVDGTYTAKVTGKLTMHNITKDVNTNATILVKGGKVSATCNFNVTLADYGIKTDRIGKTAAINISTGDLTKL